MTRILDNLSYEIPSLKKLIAIDEFKGNAGTGKYQCMLAVPVKCKVLYLPPDRIRKQLQQTMIPTLRKYYKRSKTLIHKRYDSLNQQEREACDVILLKSYKYENIKMALISIAGRDSNESHPNT